MKLPSFSTITESAFFSFKRFPLALIVAFIGTGLSIYIIESIDDIDSVYSQIISTCFLALPCMIGCHLFAERLSGKSQKLLTLITGLILMVLYGIFLAPSTEHPDKRTVLLFYILVICMHLWVSVAAYIARKEHYGFWRFNEVLFTRTVLSAIFSGVLYGGLALALGSLDQLFNINIDGYVYLKLWFFVAGVFNTWFFLSGIPSNYKEVDTEKTFPKGLKVFTQYILIPLAIIYMAILYAYGIKIIAEWSLPRGWVSILIMSYSVVGILAILLAYPLRDTAQNAWVKLFARFFFIAIMPLIVLLFVAIYTRVNEYGITEPRYYLMLLGCWLAVMALYYTFSKQKNMKLIPISLVVLGLFSLFSPWNTFRISRNSQLKRLEQIFAQYEMIGAEGITKPKDVISDEDQDQIRDVIRYLVNNRYYDGLSDLYKADVSKIADELNEKHDRWKAISGLRDTLHSMSHIEGFTHSDYENYYIRAKDQSFDVGGYNQIAHIDHWYLKRRKGYEIELTDSSYVVLNHIDRKIVVHQGDDEIATIGIDKLGRDLVKKGDKETLPINNMMILGEGKKRVKLILYEVDIDNKGHMSNIRGFLLLE